MSRRTDKNRLPVRVLRAVRSALKREDWAAARTVAEAAVDAKPDCAEAHYVLALAAIYCDDLAAALQAATQALETAPGIGDYEDLLAVIYGLAGDVNNALFHGKAAARAPRLAHLSGITPDTFPTLAQVFLQINERPLLHRGLAALAQGHWAAAERWLRQHLVFDPESREAAIGLGASLLASDAPLAAVEALRAARHRLPGDAAIASLLGRALTRTGAFDLAHVSHVSAARMAPDDCELAAVALFDALADPRGRSENIAEDYGDWRRAHVVGKDGGKNGGADCARFDRDPDRPLRIGYVIGGIAGLPVAPWLAEILSRRDTSRFAAIGFGAGALSAPANQTFQKCFDGWQDVADADALTLAAMVGAEDIDILVDLAGLAAPALHAAFGTRMAPCQVAWLGLPALAAPAAVDFILTDRFVDAQEASDAPPVAARPVNLKLGCTLATQPGALAVTDERNDIAGEVLLVADAGLGELNAVTAECWSAILHAVPGAKLVLRDRGLTQPDALKQVIDIFGSFGVAHRIDVIDEASPRAFFAHGHVALLPMPCPRPESLSDALSAGIPVVCPVGAHRSGRAAASILTHLGLAADTVGLDREGYIAHGVRWASDDAARAAFSQRLADAMARSGVWEATARARDLEEAFATMWAATSASGERALSAISA